MEWYFGFHLWIFLHILPTVFPAPSQAESQLWKSLARRFPLVVQSLGHFQLLATLWTTACRVSLSFTISWSLLKLITIESVMLSNHLILCHPLLLLPSVFPSIGIFSNEWSLCIKWPKYWNFSISPSKEYSGFISFRIAWFYLLTVQRTVKSCLQHHSLKASILHFSSFFIAQLSHAYMTTGKTIARQYIKKQRHHFAYKGPYSQSYDFSSRHVWM